MSKLNQGLQRQKGNDTEYVKAKLRKGTKHRNITKDLDN